MPEDKPVPATAAAATRCATTKLSQWLAADDRPRSEGITPLPREIERRFLVVNDTWKRDVLKSEHLRDGLIARFGEGKVRVRVTDSRASLTIKGPRKGIVREEYEYEIPRDHAEHMLQTLCQADPILEKVRHTVPFGGLNWSVDVYLGSLAGFVFAEVELENPNQQLQLAPWVGEEVTLDPRFRKHALLASSRAAVQDGSLRM